MTCTPSCTLISMSWVSRFPRFLFATDQSRLLVPLPVHAEHGFAMTRGGVRGGGGHGCDGCCFTPPGASRHPPRQGEGRPRGAALPVQPSSPLLRRQYRCHAAHHFRPQRLQPARRAHHHLELGHAAVGIEADHVDALQFLAADLGTELQDGAVIARSRTCGDSGNPRISAAPVAETVRPATRLCKACGRRASGTPHRTRIARRLGSSLRQRHAVPRLQCPLGLRVEWHALFLCRRRHISQPAGAGGGDSLLLGGIGPRGFSLTRVQPPASSGSRRNSLNPKVPSDLLMILTALLAALLCKVAITPEAIDILIPSRQLVSQPHADSASGSSISVESAPLITVSFNPGAALAMFSAKKRAIAIGCAWPPLRAAASAPRAR